MLEEPSKITTLMCPYLENVAGIFPDGTTAIFVSKFYDELHKKDTVYL